MDIRAVDLNLLKAFDALIRERAVTRAAGRIGLSQPAIYRQHPYKGKIRFSFSSPGREPEEVKDGAVR